MRSVLVGIYRGAACIALALLAGCATAPVAVIHGTVALPGARSRTASGARGASEAVVYLEAIPAPAPAKKSAPPVPVGKPASSSTAASGTKGKAATSKPAAAQTAHSKATASKPTSSKAATSATTASKGAPPKTAKPPSTSAAATGRSAAPALPHHPRSTLAFEAGVMLPHVVPVTVGDSVVFVNKDQRFHSAFSVSPAKKFDLGSLRPGAARLASFDRRGVVRVFCKLHPDSSAFVFVSPTAVWVRPDAAGAFAFPPLPPGSYDVRVWHPVYGDRRRTVVLPEAGAAVAFDY